MTYFYFVHLEYITVQKLPMLKSSQYVAKMQLRTNWMLMRRRILIILGRMNRFLSLKPQKDGEVLIGGVVS